MTPRLEDLRSYLQLLAGGTDGLIEFRYCCRDGGMRRRFHHPGEHETLARLIIALGIRTDVYTGVALRTRRHGGRQAIDRSHLVHVEIDHPGAR
jgi:hypothetical protein